MPALLIACRKDWLAFTNSIFGDTNSAWSGVDGAAFYADRAIAVGESIGLIKKVMYCQHRDKDSRHTCEECSGIYPCTQVKTKSERMLCYGCLKSLKAGSADTVLNNAVSTNHLYSVKSLES
jgi:hypothetical protein